MSWVTAQQVLDAHFMALPSLGASNIQWPNEVLDPQTSLYYANHFLPMAVDPELQGGDHEKGVYQSSVFIPKDQGIGPALVAAQAVVDWFKRQNLSGISCGVPKLGPPLQEPNWWHIPVSIP